MQAILITAYKDFDYLKYLIHSLKDDEIFLFIHIDKRFYDEHFFDEYKNNKHVNIISTREIIWGSIHHLNAILDLLKCASSYNIDFEYFHVITGQDYMYRNINEFKRFFKDRNDNFMSCTICDKSTEFRYKKFFRNDVINYKNKLGNYITKLSYILQKLFFINRKPKNITMYKGLVYVSITNDFVSYILDYINCDEGKYFLNYLKWCFIPEEFFFQTVLMNSKFKDTLNTDNKRYMLWKFKNGTDPAILDISDIRNIENSGDDFFMRKVNFKYSKELIDYFNSKEGKNEL